MSYSCCDFTDDILNALKIDVPDDSLDSPSDQADLALAEIERLQKCEAELKELKAKTVELPATSRASHYS